MSLGVNIDVICIGTFHFRIGLGTLLSGARHITDGMLQAAAEWYVHINLDACFFRSTKSH